MAASRWTAWRSAVDNLRTMSSLSSGFTVWLTGLSGAGKTTLSAAVADEIRARGQRVEVLDGDVVRTNLSKGLGFSREDRDTNIRRIGFVAKLLSRNEVAVVVAAISPYRAGRGVLRPRQANGHQRVPGARAGTRRDRGQNDPGEHLRI